MTGVRARVPFPGLNYYGFEDADLFFGREEETRKMVGEILSTRLLVLFSPSGSGKTSLIQAGVRPQLEKLGYKTIYTRMENEPIPSLCHAVAGELDIPVGTVCGQQPDLHDFLKQAAAQAGKPLVIFLDQFEEFFIVYRDRPDLRAEFVRQAARIRQDDSLHVFLVLSLREDYFASLHEFSEAIPSIFQNNANIRLKPFSDEAARRAVEEPLKAVGFSIEEGLTDLLVRDLKKTHNREEKDLSKTLVDPAAQPDPGIEPIKLQIVCSELWNRGDETHSRISTAAYQAGGGVDSIVNRFIMERLKKISRTRRKLMERIFNALKTPDNTKRYRSIEDLTAQLNIKRKKHFKRLLGQLEQLDILRREERGGTTWYEFRHDYLVREVIRWMEERREKRNRRRLKIAGFPGILLFLVLFIYFFIQYNTYYAEFTDKDYPDQKVEIVISRGFNPFKERIFTGYFKNDLKGLPSENAVKNRLKISFWDKNEWSGIADVLLKVEGGEFLYKIGKTVDGFKLFREALKAGDNVDECFDKLAKIGRFDSRAIDIVMEAMNDKNLPATVRYYAARALGNIGKPDKVVIEALLQALKDKVWDVRSSAAQALGNIGKPDRVVIEALLQALKDEDSGVRSSAAQALGNIGKPDKVVIEALTAVLKHSASDVHSSAAQALGNLLQSKTDLQLLDMLQHNDSGYRKAAAYALAEKNKNKKNPLSKETLQKIADSRTQDPRPWVRLAAWDAFYLLHEEKEGTSDD